MIYYIGDPRFITSDLYKESTIEKCYNWLIKLIIVALDIETEGLFNRANKMIMLQLSDGVDTWVIDTRTVNISILKDKLESILILGQNLKFDYKFLKQEGILLNRIYDTFIAEVILNNGLENVESSLEFLCKKYCNIQLDKSVRNQFIKLQGSPFTDNQIVYGSGDVQHLFKIKESQEVQIKNYNLFAVIKLEFSACLALADIEYNGLGFSTEPWLKLSDKAKLNLIKYEEELDKLILEEPKLKKFVKRYTQLGMFDTVDRPISIKWSSPVQVQKVFKELGLDIESSSEKEIQKFQYAYPLVKKFIDFKKESKVITTYGESFLEYINPATRRIHTDFWQIKETNRVSSNKPNLQNLPAKNEYLNCFTAEKGYKIIGIDYSGQEARIAACGSKDVMWLNTFKEGKDLHSEVCKMMFGITDELVRTKPDFLRGKTYRDVAKTINFGVLFGMSKFKLSNTLQVSLEEADNLIIKYFEATKQLKTYLDNCANYGLTRGYIRSFSPYSGIRFFPKWKKDLSSWEDKKIIGEITRASYNTPIQMTAAIMTKLALSEVRKYIIDNKLDNKVKLVHVVHDAIYTECIEEFAEEFSIIQSNIMKEAGKKFNLELDMDTDITITDSWSK